MNFREWLADKLGWILGGLVRSEVRAKIEGAGAPAKKAPTAGKLPGAGKALALLAVAVVFAATVACAPFLEGFVRGLGGGPMIPTDQPPVSAVTPTPAPPACCTARGGLYGEAAPGRVCRTDLPEGDRDCWHVPAGCDYCWSYIPAVPTPAPTSGTFECPPGTVFVPGSHSASLCMPVEHPAPSATPAPPTPTATPTQAQPTVNPATPTASPTAPPVPPPGSFCALEHFPWLWPAPPSVPVPVLKTKPCPAGFGEIGPDRFGHVGCSIDWERRADQMGRSPAQGTHVSLIDNHDVIDTDGMVRDIDNHVAVGEDRYGRHVINGQFVDFTDRPWWDGEYAHPVWCDGDPSVTPTSTPTQRPGGPTATPTPFYPPKQPDDFRLNFVNGCNELKYQKEQDGVTCGLCDTTRRFIATLKSGKRWGNACDADHFHYAKEACPDASDEVLQQHRDTFELCAGRDWDGPGGSRLETQNGMASVTQSEENPFQFRVCGNTGETVEIRACMPDGERTFDGLPVPGGPGCGPWKTVRFGSPNARLERWNEVRRAMSPLDERPLLPDPSPVPPRADVAPDLGLSPTPAPNAGLDLLAAWWFFSVMGQ